MAVDSVSHGVAAEAIRTAEVSLARQQSVAAQVDLQLVTALLNAHGSHQEGAAALDRLQQDIEAAVLTRPDLSTPAGARSFQRFLIDRLRDIRAVVDGTELDSTSKAAVAAALSALYSTAETTTAAADPEPSEVPPPGPEYADVVDDGIPMVDGAGLEASPVAGAPFGGGTMPTLPPFSGPPLSGPPLSGSPLSGSDPLGGTSLADVFGRHAGNATSDTSPDSGEADGRRDDPAGTDDQPDAREGGGGDLPAVISAAVSGMPISEAFRLQGMPIPEPGSPVDVPLPIGEVVAGDVGILTDRHALALGNGKALLDSQIQPITAVGGPDFLGWLHPRQPQSGAQQSAPDTHSTETPH